MEISPSPCLPCMSFLKSLYPFIPTVGSFHHISVMSKNHSPTGMHMPLIPHVYFPWHFPRGKLGIFLLARVAGIPLCFSSDALLLTCNFTTVSPHLFLVLIGEGWTEGSFLWELCCPIHYENSAISCSNHMEKSDSQMECL